MTDTQRIERIEEVLGTFIAWTARELGHDNAKALLDNLHTPRAAKPVEAATPVSENEIWAEWSDGNGGTFRAGRVKPESPRKDE